MTAVSKIFNPIKKTFFQRKICSIMIEVCFEMRSEIIKN